MTGWQVVDLIHSAAIVALCIASIYNSRSIGTLARLLSRRDEP